MRATVVVAALCSTLLSLAACRCASLDQPVLSTQEYRTVARVRSLPVSYEVGVGPGAESWFDWAYFETGHAVVASAAFGQSALSSDTSILKTGRSSLPALLQVPRVAGEQRALVVVGADDDVASVLVSAIVGDGAAVPLFRCLQRVPLEAGAAGSGRFWLAVSGPQLCGLCPTTGEVALVQVSASGIEATHCSAEFAQAVLHPTKPIGAAPFDGGVVEFTLGESGPVLGLVAPVSGERLQFYPLDGQARLFVRGGSQDPAFDVSFLPGGPEVRPSALSPLYFEGMTSADGVTVDAINRGQAGMLVHTWLDADGGVSIDEFPAELEVSDGYKLAPHLGHPAIFLVADAGSGEAQLRGRLLR